MGYQDLGASSWSDWGGFFLWQKLETKFRQISSSWRTKQFTPLFSQRFLLDALLFLELFFTEFSTGEEGEGTGRRIRNKEDDENVKEDYPLFLGGDEWVIGGWIEVSVFWKGYDTFVIEFVARWISCLTLISTRREIFQCVTHPFGYLGGLIPLIMVRVKQPNTY